MNNRKSGHIFDTYARSYDLWYDSDEGRPLYESELRCIKPLVHEGRPLLEIGVGTGRFAMRFLPAFGVDTAIKTLKIAQGRGIKAVCAEGGRLPFKDGVFCHVLIVVTLCFVRSPFDVVKEAGRVLKDGGSIIIGFIPKDSPWGELYEEKKKKGHPIYGAANFYTLKDVERFLGESGLRVERIRSTLLRKPDEKRKIEEPSDGYVSGAGFVCIEAKKT